MRPGTATENKAVLATEAVDCGRKSLPSLVDGTLDKFQSFLRRETIPVRLTVFLVATPIEKAARGGRKREKRRQTRGEMHESLRSGDTRSEAALVADVGRALDPPVCTRDSDVSGAARFVFEMSKDVGEGCVCVCVCGGYHS